MRVDFKHGIGVSSSPCPFKRIACRLGFYYTPCILRKQFGQLYVQPSITSLQNPRIKSALRLHSSRGRKQQSRIIVFGHREIQRAALANVDVQELFFNEDGDPQHLEKMARLAQQMGIAPTWVSALVFNKLCYGNRDDCAVAVANRPPTSLDAIPLKDRMCFVVVESVEKPGNIGAMVRSIDASGACGLLMANPTTDPFHPNAIRASTGAVFSTPVATGTSESMKDWLLANQFTVFPAIVQSSKSIFETDLTPDRIAFVLGNEANGLSEVWRDGALKPIHLPMQGCADSLNVSVTAAVMLFEGFRQRSLIESSE